MQTTAVQRIYPAYDPIHLIGTVLRVQDDAYVVLCDGREWRAKRAASCLLAPAEGDSVLISGPDAGRVYLIAVIEQADASAATLDVEGRLLLRSRSGDVSLEAARDLNLASGKAVRMETGSLEVRAEQADCVTGSARYVASELNATVGTLRLVGKVYEAVVDRISHLSRLMFRMASEVEHVRVGNLDVKAEQSARVHASYTMVTADKLVKVDAKQIHMG